MIYSKFSKRTRRSPEEKERDVREDDLLRKVKLRPRWISWEPLNFDTTSCPVSMHMPGVKGNMRVFAWIVLCKCSGRTRNTRTREKNARHGIGNVRQLASYSRVRPIVRQCDALQNGTESDGTSARECPCAQATKCAIGARSLTRAHLFPAWHPRQA